MKTRKGKILVPRNLGFKEDDCACENIFFLRATALPNIAQDEDCACAGGAINNADLASRSLSVIYQHTPKIVEIPLADKFTAYAVGDSQGLLVLSQTAKQVYQSFEKNISVQEAVAKFPCNAKEYIIQTAYQLVSFGFLSPIEQNHACITDEDCAPSVSPSLITSWLHLTDRCNLRCDYCYLRHVREDMSLETGRAAIDATFRSATANDFKQVKLKYAGGEPFLRFPLIVELHRYAQLLAELHGLGLEGIVLSNGTLLTAAMVETLKVLGLRLMISLDGMGQYHDNHRPYASGRGSFIDVVEAVDLALANNLTPSISVTVSSRTAEGLPRLMDWLLARDLPFSLNFYRENDLSAFQEDMRLDEQKIIKGMLSAFKVIEDHLPRRPFLGGIIDRANLSAVHRYTCGVGQNYLVFDQNGQAAKCQMHIRKPITDTNAADPLSIIRAERNGVQNVPVDEKEDCKACEWRYWCTGGCPLETYRVTGRYDVKSPNCNIYKSLFPEAFRLEGLRLLKYQDDPEVVMTL